MKKYKLKIWYPSLPKDIKVGDEVELSGEYYCMKLGDTCIEKEHVENNPEFWEKITEPLCITEDGVELFDQMNVIYEVIGFTLSERSCSVGYGIDYRYAKSKGRLYFSTREAAEKWVEENKPVFSKKQLRDLLDTTYPEYTLKIPQIKALFKL